MWWVEEWNISNLLYLQYYLNIVGERRRRSQKLLGNSDVSRDGMSLLEVFLVWSGFGSGRSRGSMTLAWV